MIAAMSEILSWALWATLLAASVAMTAFFCGMETGVYVLNKIRLDLRAEEGSAPARLLRRLVRNPANMLAVVLTGTNLAAYAATFSVSAMFVMGGLGHHAEWYTMAVATPLLFILGESVPKNVFQRRPEPLMYRYSWLLGTASVVLNASGLALAVRAFSSTLTRLAARRRNRARLPLGHEGFAAIVAEGRAAGVLTHFQSIMADRVMHISDVTLADVMIPMSQAVWAPADAGRAKLLELVAEHIYTRLPLRESGGQVVGVVDVFDVLTSQGPKLPPELVSSPRTLPARMTITDALYRMQRDRVPMAVVVDETNRHVGIVTIKDIVEEIVGELDMQ